jgi:PPOX class probable F420-dependent enzyme
MATMTNTEREAFLAPPRLGMLTTLKADGTPITVPVWFDWDGRAVGVFASATSGKVRRLERNPHASLLVANNVGEPEAWVAFDGAVTITAEGASELAERLAERYWDMSDAAHRATVESWRQHAAGLRLLTLLPSAIRTSTG